MLIFLEATPLLAPIVTTSPPSEFTSNAVVLYVSNLLQLLYVSFTFSPAALLYSPTLSVRGCVY